MDGHGLGLLLVRFAKFVLRVGVDPGGGEGWVDARRGGGVRELRAQGDEVDELALEAEVCPAIRRFVTAMDFGRAGAAFGFAEGAGSFGGGRPRGARLLADAEIIIVLFDGLAAEDPPADFDHFLDERHFGSRQGAEGVNVGLEQAVKALLVFGGQDDAGRLESMEERVLRRACFAFGGDGTFGLSAVGPGSEDAEFAGHSDSMMQDGGTGFGLVFGSFVARKGNILLDRW